LSAVKHHGAPVMLTGEASHLADGPPALPRIIVRERKVVPEWLQFALSDSGTTGAAIRWRQLRPIPPWRSSAPFSALETDPSRP